MSDPGFTEAVRGRVAALAAEDVPERLWQADTTLWKDGDPEHQAIVANALGWLSVFEAVRDEVDGLRAFVDELKAEGYRSAVLLGMGGSSLAPEVMHAILGTQPGYLDLHVLDSTDPAAVAAVEAAVDLETTAATRDNLALRLKRRAMAPTASRTPAGWRWPATSRRRASPGQSSSSAGRRASAPRRPGSSAPSDRGPRGAALAIYQGT